MSSRHVQSFLVQRFAIFEFNVTSSDYRTRLSCVHALCNERHRWYMNFLCVTEDSMVNKRLKFSWQKTFFFKYWFLCSLTYMWKSISVAEKSQLLWPSSLVLRSCVNIYSDKFVVFVAKYRQVPLESIKKQRHLSTTTRFSIKFFHFKRTINSKKSDSSPTTSSKFLKLGLIIFIHFFHSKVMKDSRINVLASQGEQAGDKLTTFTQQKIIIKTRLRVFYDGF